MDMTNTTGHDGQNLPFVIHGKVRTYQNVDYPFFHTEGLNAFLHPELVAVHLPYQDAVELLTEIGNAVTQRGSYLERTGQMEFKGRSLEWATMDRYQTIVFFPEELALSDLVQSYVRPDNPSQKLND